MTDSTNPPMETPDEGDELTVPSYSDDEQRLADDQPDEPADDASPEPDEDPRGYSGYDPANPQYHLDDPREAVELAQDNFRREGLR